MVKHGVDSERHGACLATSQHMVEQQAQQLG